MFHNRVQHERVSFNQVSFDGLLLCRGAFVCIFTVTAFLGGIGWLWVVVLGDLNATPWSYYFRRFVRESGLVDSSKGKGIQATWPAGFFPLLIPIDHCLASPDIGVVGKMIGGNVGSDHLPVAVDLDLSSAGSRKRL